MVQLFDPENRFWQFLGKITDAACLSVLWLITSLPLITIGASTTAFYEYTLKSVQNLEGSLFKSYFKSFRVHFKRSTLLWLIQLAGTLFFAADLWAAWQFFLSRGGAAGVVMMGVCGFCALVFFCCCFYTFPVLALYGLPLRKLIVTSFFLSIGSLHVTITLIVLLLLACVLTFYLSGFFFFWVGLFIFASSYFIYGVFLRFPWLETEDNKEAGTEAQEDPKEEEEWLM